MADKIFAEGMHFDPPADAAPTWVKGKISIRVRDFIPFLEQHKNERGFVTIDIKESKGGNYYCELNQWRKDQRKKEPETGNNAPYPDVDISPDDIPF
jgi:hypothetical protein